jgi:DNA-binding transcriptional LysR family regulator
MANLEHLRTFVTVFRTGSLSSAAALLGISQPTATAHISALEHSLGYSLFERSRTGVLATSKGEALARLSAPHVDALEDVDGDAEDWVHLGGAPEFLTTMVLPHLAKISPKVIVTFGLADDLLDSLRAGGLDIVLSTVQPRGTRLVAQPFYDEEFALVAAPSWSGTPLEEVPVIAYSGSLPIVRRYWRTVFGRRPSELVIAAIIPDLRGVLAAVESGAGMSVLPTYLLRKSSVIWMHTPEFAPLNSTYLVTRAGDTRHQAVLDALSKIE